MFDAILEVCTEVTEQKSSVRITTHNEDLSCLCLGSENPLVQSATGLAVTGSTTKSSCRTFASLTC